MKNNKNYFTKETEQAIVLYNNTLDLAEKSEIYRIHLQYPFFKLTENLIHTFKFYHTEVENLEDLQHEVIIFLLSKIHRFDPDLGFKAYSFFGTIAKRYLIVKNKQNYKKKIKSIPVDGLNENENHSYLIDDDYDSKEAHVTERLSLFIDEYIKYCTDNIYTLFPKSDEAQIADAVLELFRKRDVIEIFNKKALYIYIREQIDVKTPKLTKVVDTLKNIFSRNYIFYLEHGFIDFK